jgi:hypothetical protein
MRWTALVTLFLAVPVLEAEELPSIFGENPIPLQMWAVRQGGTFDSDRSASTAAPAEEQSRKSPRRALLLSVLVPGAGQYYTGSTKRAATFLGIEALAVGLYMFWSGDGNSIEDEFRETADDKWDPLEYLDWRGDPVSRNSSITHALPCSTAIRVSNGRSLRGCSEKQQYYELLGKYDQFVAGWSDLKDPNGNLISSVSVIDSVENFTSELRLDYEVRRDDSNKLLKRASNVAGVIMLNHIFSAIDAARIARRQDGSEQTSSMDRRTRFAATIYQGSRSRVPMVVAYKPFY